MVRLVLLLACPAACLAAVGVDLLGGWACRQFFGGDLDPAKQTEVSLQSIEELLADSSDDDALAPVAGGSSGGGKADPREALRKRLALRQAARGRGFMIPGGGGSSEGLVSAALTATVPAEARKELVVL